MKPRDQLNTCYLSQKTNEVTQNEFIYKTWTETPQTVTNRKSAFLIILWKTWSLCEVMEENIFCLALTKFWFIPSKGEKTKIAG